MRQHSMDEAVADGDAVGALRAIKALLTSDEAERGLSREELGRLLGCSVRSLTNWEVGTAPKEGSARLILQIARLALDLSEVMAEEKISGWLLRPNRALGGSKPLELIERGELSRVARAVFEMRSGQPS